MLQYFCEEKMKNHKMTTFTFPIGYHNFHRKQLFNFQLNRWYSMGYTRLEDIQKVGKRINNFHDWKHEMLQLAENAVSEQRLMNAAFYYRAAEFYTFQDDSDKALLYDRFISLFYKSFENDEIEQYKVPFLQTFLPVMKLNPLDDKKGTIIMHGGFDSFIEEFYSWMRYFSDNGYEVIAFEGPGQGAARKKYGLVLNYQWEKPTKAILDYFKLNEVTLHGISMGGWFCFRAAAFEPRIKRVIASSIAYDYLKTHNILARKMMNYFVTRHREYLNKMSLKSLKKDGMLKWTLGNLMYITDKKTPVDAMEVAFQLTADNLHSDLVRQDVLILTGRNDHFIPFKMHKMQIKALTNAKSITARIFTKNDHAQNHCQIGNVGLALDSIVKWIETKS